MSSESLRGMELIELGRTDEGLQLLEAMIVEAESPYDVHGCFRHAALGYVPKGDLARAKAYFAHALSLAEDIGVPMGVGLALGELGYLSSLLCEWREVEVYLDRLENILNTVDLRWDRPTELRLLLRGQMCFAQGEWDQCSQFIHEGMSVREGSGDSHTLAPLHQALAEMELMRGHAESAQTSLKSVLARNDVSEKHITSLLPLLAWARLELGDSSGARELAEKAVRRARNHGMHLYLADALWIMGLAASRCGLASEAVHSLAAALELSRSLSYGRGEGRGLYAQGLAAIERSDLPAAKTGLTVFQRLGLQPYIAKTERALSGLA
jgi:tetratricopeptide (TPR) repeat protein